MAPFADNVGELADSLGGTLNETVAKPEFILENLTEDQVKAIVNILQALDSYFIESDINILDDELRQANEAFGDHLLAVPFAATIISGMEKLGIGVSDGDVRSLALYDYVRPYLQHQGGFIKFKALENGVEKEFTIRVGLTTNSIYFNTPATENVLKFVRERVIMK